MGVGLPSMRRLRFSSLRGENCGSAGGHHRNHPTPPLFFPGRTPTIHADSPRAAATVAASAAGRTRKPG